MTYALSSIHIYPLKSCAPLALAHAQVEPRGLAHDRRWMVIDAGDNFMTGRDHPRLTLIHAVPQSDGSLQLDASGMSSLRVAAPPAQALRVASRVWNDAVSPRLAAPAAHAWLSRFLGVSCRLVWMDDDCVRPANPRYAAVDETVSFADGFPLLLISQAALDLLNGKLARPISMLRFRPNLVVSGTAAHAEDGWKRIRIGCVEFDLVKTCTRCVFTTVDFERGERDASGEPLRTLIGYRRTDSGITFGQNLIARGSGQITVGDPVDVLG